MRFIEATLLSVGSALKLKAQASQGMMYDYGWCSANPGSSNCQWNYYYNPYPAPGCQWWDAICNEGEADPCDQECKNTWHEINHDNLELRWKDDGLDWDAFGGYVEEFLQDAYMGWKHINDENNSNNGP